MSVRWKEPEPFLEMVVALAQTRFAWPNRGSVDSLVRMRSIN